MTLASGDDGRTSKRRWKWREIRDDSQHRYGRSGSLGISDDRGTQKLRGNAEKNKEAKEKFAGPPASEKTLKPGAQQALERNVHPDKQNNDQQDGREKSKSRHCNTNGHGHHPAGSTHGGKVGETIRQADDVKRAEAEWKTQQGTEFEGRAKSRKKNREGLPEQADAPEKEQKPGEMTGRYGEIGAPPEQRAQPDDEQARKDRGQDESNEIEAGVSLARQIPQNAPAQFGDEANLRKEAGASRYVSHDSSSSWDWVPPP